jgi:hypothetical protein
MFNQERLLLTNEKSIREAIGRKSYDWEKSSPFRIALSPILGNGLVLSAGHEHKVILPYTTMRHLFLANTHTIVSAEDLSFCVQPKDCSADVSNYLAKS